jgi:hypothetical protein
VAAVTQLRDRLVHLVNLIFAGLAALLALAMLVSFGHAAWLWLFGDGSVVGPTVRGFVFLVLALVSRELARLDEYHFVPATTTTTTTRRGGGARSATRKVNP